VATAIQVDRLIDDDLVLDQFGIQQRVFGSVRATAPIKSVLSDNREPPVIFSRRSGCNSQVQLAADLAEPAFQRWLMPRHRLAGG
jgi:hypothetical protein